MNLREPEDMTPYPNPTPPYLRHKPSGYVYIYSDVLFRQGDMEPCQEIPEAQRPKEKGKEVKTEGPPPVDTTQVTTPPKTEGAIPNPDADPVKEEEPTKERPLKFMNLAVLLNYAKKKWGIEASTFGAEPDRKEVLDSLTLMQISEEAEKESKPAEETTGEEVT